MLNQPATTTEDYATLLNENFNTIEDKMLYRAIATFDSTQAAHILQLQNIPLQHQAGLPQGLPDTFAVSVRFLEAFTEGDIIRIGAVDFTPKYAGFEAGDLQTVTFDMPGQACFFRAGGGNKFLLAAYCGSSYMASAYMGVHVPVTSISLSLQEALLNA